MGKVKNVKGKFSITTADFIGAAFFYVMVALEVLIGDLPSKSNNYSPGFYEHNAGFFWTIVGFQTAYGLYWLAGGIKTRLRQRANVRISAEKGNLSIDGAINIGAATCLACVGLCFSILPVIEVKKEQIYGGEIFKNHLSSAEPAVFWQLLGFHLIVSMLPVFGSVLLIMFPPKRDYPVEVRLNYSEQF